MPVFYVIRPFIPLPMQTEQPKSFFKLTPQARLASFKRAFSPSDLSEFVPLAFGLDSKTQVFKPLPKAQPRVFCKYDFLDADSKNKGLPTGFKPLFFESSKAFTKLR